MMPCSRAGRTRSATGRINAVGEVRWLAARTRVRGVTCCQIASTMSRAERTGTDKGARRQRPRDDVHPGRSIGDVRQVVRVGAHVRGQRLPRLAHQGLEPAAGVEKPHRLPLELALPGLVDLKDRTRAGAPKEPWLRKMTSGSSRNRSR